MKIDWSIVKNISIVNTARMNMHYFGICSIFKPRILVSRNLKIDKLSGKCFVKTDKICAVKLGFGYVGIVDRKYRRSIWENRGNIYFEGTCNLGIGTKISCGEGGTIYFGNECNFNANSDIVCKKSITFGHGCLVSWECLFMDSDFHRIYDVNNELCNGDQDIVIGSHVWIGCRSTILKGTEIPDNSVIAACSRVNKKLEDRNCVYASNKIAKRNIEWI